MSRETSNPAKFPETIVPIMLDEMRALGASSSARDARRSSAARACSANSCTAPAINIGERNIVATREVLAAREGPDRRRGHGTRLRTQRLLPSSPTGASRCDRSRREIVSSSATPPSVLVVDDSAFMRRIIGADHRRIAASSASSARRATATTRSSRSTRSIRTSSRSTSTCRSSTACRRSATS